MVQRRKPDGEGGFAPRSPLAAGRPAPAAKRRAVLVLGMHRSGTSAVAGVVRALGAAPPKTPMGPHRDNPRGYFESQALFIAHDEMLSAAGTRWDDCRPIDRHWFRSTAAQQYHRKIRAIFIEEFGDEPLILVKDPRICRFMPFTEAILAELGISGVAVLPIRNPLEVAYSLQRRDGFGPAKSFLVWLRHVLDAELYSRHLPRYFLAYEDFLADWRHHVDRIADVAGVAQPAWADRSAAEIDGFLSVELRRERATLGDLDIHPASAQLIRDAYRIFTDIAAGGESTELLERLDAVRTQFDKDCDAFGAALAEQEAARERAVAERDALAADGNKLAGERDAFAAERDRLAAARDALAADRDKMTAERDALARQHASLKAAHAGVLGSRTWRLTAPLRSLTRLLRR